MIKETLLLFSVLSLFSNRMLSSIHLLEHHPVSNTGVGGVVWRLATKMAAEIFSSVEARVDLTKLLTAWSLLMSAG
ncbi:hypothetical protein DFP73DRAFT_561045 [Morchella snyderi]|nr:hypothetical protein DFP73DRAFT_561045 [Morchella snyderi]